MSRLIRWLRRLLFGPKGYWICPDDWQGETLGDCTYCDELRPVRDVRVYYRSGGALKPWGRR